MAAVGEAELLFTSSPVGLHSILYHDVTAIMIY